MNNILIFLLIGFIVLTTFIFFIIISIKYPKKIDAVYTWVEFDDSLKKDLEEENAPYMKDDVNCRDSKGNLTVCIHLKANYYDNNELLFSLRSLDLYAPWFHKIYIVVRDGQRPKWLADNPRVTLVNHSTIIPPQYLPTFNSMAIESFLHKIPGLSEYFVYFNDDMIILNPVQKTHFFNMWGIPVESKCHEVKEPSPPVKFYDDGKETKEDMFNFHQLLYFNNSILNTYFKKETRFQSQHIPNPHRKSFMNKLDRFLDQIYIDSDESVNELTKKSRNRKNTNIARNSLIKKYWNKYAYGAEEQIFSMDYIEINHLKSVEMDYIKTSKAQFLCIQNSIAYGDKDANIGIQDYKTLNKILNEKFPNPSSFEK